MELEGALEGLLFVAGDEGLTTTKIKEILKINDEELKRIILSLQNQYCDKKRGIKIKVLGSSLKLVTKEEHKEFYQQLFDEKKNDVLSQSGLETLAIIAYNEPITRIQIDEIRGVNSSYVLRTLSMKGLIEERGRSELPGRPILYGVTNQFLDYFGLQTIDDLPKLEVTTEEETSETDLFASKYVEQ